MERGEKDKRRRILEAAERLFSEKNFGKTQISEIAKAAGVGVGTFYRHFPDKDALLEELLAALFSEIREELAETRRGIESWAPLEQILSVRRTFEVGVKVMLDRPNLMLTFLRSGYGGSARVSEKVWNLVGGIIEDLAADIARAESVGIIRASDSLMMAHAIIGVVLQLVHRVIVEGRPSLDETVNLCTRLTFGMLFAFVPPENYERVLPIYSMILPPVGAKESPQGSGPLANP